MPTLSGLHILVDSVLYVRIHLFTIKVCLKRRDKKRSNKKKCILHFTLLSHT